MYTLRLLACAIIGGFVLSLDALIMNALMKGLRRLDLTGYDTQQLPSSLFRLSGLQQLVMMGGGLTRLPPEIGKLKSLEVLNLLGNQLAELPPEIGDLTSLRQLSLGDNKLTTVPRELGQLRLLQELNLSMNQLISVPPEIGNLSSLRKLSLEGGKFSALPSELGQLVSLEELRLSGSTIKSLPASLSRLRKLKLIELSRTDPTDPPSEIIRLGTAAIVEYLQALDVETEKQWTSKLVLVGQGGVGKTCLLRSLQRLPFQAGESTTHGINTSSVLLPHPVIEDAQMTLNAWDFGGQDIYHATHQFFLSNRSLFLVVWNARQGFTQSRLYYWLDTIQSLAPESPIFLVATQTDERDADLPLAEMMARYPQIAGHYEVSNKTGAGIDSLRTAVRHAAAQLPLMGQQWPSTWLKAVKALKEKPENAVTSFQFRYLLQREGVTAEAVPVLANWLHELGEILYFQGERGLEDTVILKPTWATGIVSRILTSEEVIRRAGILTKRHMREVWGDLDLATQDFCLRLMEKFDLSYETHADKEVSIVVERLPLEAPNVKSLWDGHLERTECKEVSMRYVLASTMPAGVPTWFIARQHRFSIGKHWRNGVLFADEDSEHLALVEANPHDRDITISVRGIFPQNFFSLLRDGLELTLTRFPGLRIDKYIPCPGHDGRRCTHEFSYENLIRAQERKPPKQSMECPVAMEDVPISKLLFGIHASSNDAVIQEVRRLSTKAEDHQDELRVLLSQQRELIQREFTTFYRSFQDNVDLECPNAFILRPTSKGLITTLSGPHGSSYQDDISGIAGWLRYELHLLCQKPGHWHLLSSGGHYEFSQSPTWFQEVSPLLRKLLSCLKTCVPPHGRAAATAIESALEQVNEKDIQLGEELLARVKASTPNSPSKFILNADVVHGSALRALRTLLTSLDATQSWGGLRKVLTPEGHWLWLCPDHAESYGG